MPEDVHGTSQAFFFGGVKVKLYRVLGPELHIGQYVKRLENDNGPGAIVVGPGAS